MRPGRSRGSGTLTVARAMRRRTPLSCIAATIVRVASVSGPLRRNGSMAGPSALITASAPSTALRIAGASSSSATITSRWSSSTVSFPGERTSARTW